MHRGADAQKRVQEEIQRQKEAAERRASGLYMPFRFRIPQVGESREIVILDAEPGMCFYEHGLQNPKTGKWNVFEPCPKESEICPICNGQTSLTSAKESYYVMMMTCIDLTPWTDQKGTVHPFSRLLLPVKTGGMNFFYRQFERHGTLRGMHLVMSRDSATQSSIGTPEFDCLHTEEEILASFGSQEVKGQDGKVIRPANIDCFPYPYDKLFKRPSAADLRARYGGSAPVGSRDEAAAAWAQTEATQTAGVDPEEVPM
jgi:hypothetical protein